MKYGEKWEKNRKSVRYHPNDNEYVNTRYRMNSEKAVTD